MLLVGVRLTYIRGSLAVGKFVPRGAGVLLSGTPLLAEASLPSPTTCATVYALLVPPKRILSQHEARQQSRPSRHERHLDAGGYLAVRRLAGLHHGACQRLAARRLAERHLAVGRRIAARHALNKANAGRLW
jgi:hypothetical protein